MHCGNRRLHEQAPKRKGEKSGRNSFNSQVAKRSPVGASRLVASPSHHIRPHDIEPRIESTRIVASSCESAPNRVAGTTRQRLRAASSTRMKDLDHFFSNTNASSMSSISEYPFAMNSSRRASSCSTSRPTTKRTTRMPSASASNQPRATSYAWRGM